MYLVQYFVNMPSALYYYNLGLVLPETTSLGTGPPPVYFKVG